MGLATGKKERIGPQMKKKRRRGENEQEELVSTSACRKKKQYRYMYMQVWTVSSTCVHSAHQLLYSSVSINVIFREE